jgi:hypothetical protein
MNNKIIGMKRFHAFAYNFPYDFIENCWADNPRIAEHLRKKFNMYLNECESLEGFMRFVQSLDLDNERKLFNYIDDYYENTTNKNTDS